MRHQLRNHPVAQALSASASSGRALDNDELDGLDLTPLRRKEVARVSTEVGALRLGGLNGAADDMAEREAERIVDALPVEQQDPGYLNADQDTDDPTVLADRAVRGFNPDKNPDDPAALADEVGRY